MLIPILLAGGVVAYIWSKREPRVGTTTTGRIISSAPQAQSLGDTRIPTSEPRSGEKRGGSLDLGPSTGQTTDAWRRNRRFLCNLASGCPVRSGLGDTARVVGTVPFGEEVEAIRRAGPFAYVDYPKGQATQFSGWVPTSTLREERVTKSTLALCVHASCPTRVFRAGSEYVYYGSLKRGERVTIHESPPAGRTVPAGRLYFTKPDGTEGYVESRYVRPLAGVRTGGTGQIRPAVFTPVEAICGTPDANERTGHIGCPILPPYFTGPTAKPFRSYEQLRTGSRSLPQNSRVLLTDVRNVYVPPGTFLRAGNRRFYQATYTGRSTSYFRDRQFGPETVEGWIDEDFLSMAPGVTTPPSQAPIKAARKVKVPGTSTPTPPPPAAPPAAQTWPRTLTCRSGCTFYNPDDTSVRWPIDAGVIVTAWPTDPEGRWTAPGKLFVQLPNGDIGWMDPPEIGA